MDLDTLMQYMVAGRDIAQASGVSPCHNYFVVTRSRADRVPVSLLFGRNGNKILELETGDLSALHARVSKNWQWPEPVKVLAADGKTDLYGVIYRPSDFDPGKSYPILNVSQGHCELPQVASGSFSLSLIHI